MAIVILQKGNPITREQLDIAREEYQTFIKITVDLKKEIIALGGEYHTDSEKILISQFNSNSEDIVGGGYDLNQKIFLTNAMINLRPSRGNASMEILDQTKREKFLSLAKQIFQNEET